MTTEKKKDVTMGSEQEVPRRAAVASVLGSLGLLALPGCADAADGEPAPPVRVAKTSQPLTATDGALIFWDASTFAENNQDGPIYDKTNRTLVMGASSSAYNNADSIGAVALADKAVATGNGAIALGYNNRATNTYAHAIGGNNTASGPATSCIGQGNTATGTGALSIGFANTATDTFAGVVGWYSTASTTGALALGLATSAVRYGELGHCGGQSGLSFQGVHALDMAAQLNAAPGKLLTGDPSGSLILTGNSLNSMRIRVSGTTAQAGGPKRGHAVYELQVWSKNGQPIEIDLVTVVVENWPTGWSVKFNPSPSPGISLNELMIYCDPGSDNVRFTARVEWAETFNVT